MTTKTHHFDTTGEAYDACQTGVNVEECANVEDGDTLIVLTERVVGVAGCWPFAVTAERGHFHHLVNIDAPGNGIGHDDVTAAQVKARELGFALISDIQ